MEDAEANIYNTTGSSDCPPAKFDATMSNPEKFAKQMGVPKV
ncbi:MAG: hypothetical protein ACRERE_07945 [Candidatus Entotheonellia bacterium]